MDDLSITTSSVPEPTNLDLVSRGHRGPVTATSNMGHQLGTPSRPGRSETKKPVGNQRVSAWGAETGRVSAYCHYFNKINNLGEWSLDFVNHYCEPLRGRCLQGTEYSGRVRGDAALVRLWGLQDQRVAHSAPREPHMIRLHP